MATDITVLKLSHIEKIITAFLIFIMCWVASSIKCKSANYEAQRDIIKKTIRLLFTLYLIIVIDFTLIDDSFGRILSNIFLLNNSEIKQYLSENTNFIPFETVRLFINGYKSGAVSFPVFFENVLGNFFAFMPMAFFLPVIFKRTKKFRDFLIVVSFTVICIEILQLVFLSGSGDIDDFLLNVSGAVVAYGIFKLPALCSIFSKLTYGVWEAQ